MAQVSCSTLFPALPYSRSLLFFLSHPFIQPRRLAWDVLVHIFKESDPSTLAILGRVSLDFLTATSPILYKHVETKSVESLEMLFCDRNGEKKQKKVSSVSLPLLLPLLSLFAHHLLSPFTR